jgi:hypothetical protein
MMNSDMTLLTATTARGAAAAAAQVLPAAFSVEPVACWQKQGCRQQQLIKLAADCLKGKAVATC